MHCISLKLILKLHSSNHSLRKQCLIEEVEDLGGRHRDRVESYLSNLLLRLLKREYQADKRTTSWDVSIKTSALNIRKEIKRHPSLRRHCIESFEVTYQYARELASIESQLDRP
ncbi:hypothetical protein C1752_16968 [Acaryochloris thomasi RCC1774]|uniref:Uncharacterized protein n=1 Tax=Acaryochloris thomasi RCC1774 TaxID=1764569 RepID=A0A2W1JMR7_9CYAN|nr:DUF29 family protein [Acaryochloris thomasi]PZD70197.1 hypothetical protein C1752_16968 [Acaryochloris thomasi RCC1774]